MNGKLVSVRIREGIEEFKLKDIVFDSDPTEYANNHAELYTRYCDLCGKRFWKPTAEWAYKIQSAWYERARGRQATTAIPRLFCSYSCLQRAKRITEKARRESGTRRVCEHCGAEFVSRYAARYCSQECRDYVQRRQHQDSYDTRRAGGERDGLRDENGKLWSVVKCAHCGKEFLAGTLLKKYCSNACKARAQYQRKTAEKAGKGVEQ